MSNTIVISFGSSYFLNFKEIDAKLSYVGTKILIYNPSTELLPGFI